MATNAGTTRPSAGGGHWYGVGTQVTISAAAPSVVTGERYVWNGWTGSGSVSYTGNDNPATLAVTMNGPVTETASWTHQYLVRTVTAESRWSLRRKLQGHLHPRRNHLHKRFKNLFLG